MKYFKCFFEKLLYDFIGDPIASRDRDYKLIFSRYMIVLFIIFFIHSLCNYYLFASVTDTLFLFFTCCFFLASPIVFRKHIQNKYFICIYFAVLTLIITFYSSFCGIESGTFLFYFSLLSALPIFFEYSKNKFFFLFSLFFIVLNLYLTCCTDIHIVEKYKDLSRYSRHLLTLNVMCMLIVFGLNYVILEEKKKTFHFVLDRNLHKKQHIKDLNDEVNHLKELLDKDFYTEENLKDLISSAEINDAVFIEKFELFYPHFFDKVKNLSATPLVLSELKLCALLKLGFTTKQIATYTNSSVKSVEGRKSRLRKKINIPADLDSKVWFLDIS